jgi:hypothetical protein
MNQRAPRPAGVDCLVRLRWIAVLLFTTVACSRSGRITLTSSGIAWEVIDGAWETDGDVLVGRGGEIQTTEEYGDATIELDVEQSPDPRERTVGVGLRCSFTAYDPAKTNGYEVDWTSRKRMNEFVSGASVSKPFHRVWLSSGALQPLKNHVVVRARGPTVIVEVNGTAVDSFTDDTYPRGHVRLWVETTAQTVRFARVRITPG